MNSKISNQKKEVPKGITLNDKDYITNFLSMLKEYEKNIVVALTEASNEILYNDYLNIFNTISKFQRDTYELMFKYGWYTLELASKNKINSLTKNIKNDINNLN